MFVKVKRNGWKERTIECIDYELEEKIDDDGTRYVAVICDPDSEYPTAFTFNVGEGHVFVMNNDGKTVDRFPRKGK